MLERNPVLKVTDLSAGYGDIGVLFDVSLTAWEGSVTALFGSNGAGKTTLMSAITGLIRTSTGRIELNDADISDKSAHARSTAGVALVQENKRVFRKRTVHENLILGGYRLKRSERPTSLEAAYERFPILRDKSNAKAGSLSGGQQQMLAIAQALMPGPKVLLLDEPSAGLAPIIVNELLQSIVRMKAEGMAVVLVEQLVGKALSVADHVVALQHGRVVIDADAAEVDDEKLRAAYLGARDDSAV
ncbi:ABC transporter ATP-binding protein [Nocardia sp. 348MFTsu5.1]|uniref:ABC transporter ATP-binding protein n=1 Tax=Nocardia sp. 348MFTsu5.1 TaxID=1172185 RepID=UPI0003701F53|nr:ABC transporter ATP-binding protein [Nocardia sp. 348MFTsu5.1]